MFSSSICNLVTEMMKVINMEILMYPLSGSMFAMLKSFSLVVKHYTVCYSEALL